MEISITLKSDHEVWMRNFLYINIVPKNCHPFHVNDFLTILSLQKDFMKKWEVKDERCLINELHEIKKKENQMIR